MRKKLFYPMLILLALASANVYAQTPMTITIGNATTVTGTTDASPANNWWKNYRLQMVYTAAEINAQGVFGVAVLDQIAYFVEGVPATALPNYTIKIKHTTAANAAAHDPGPFTTVYTTANFAPTGTSWNQLLFTTPFIWNGVDNILIDVCWDIIPAGFSSTGTVRYTSTPDGVRYYNSDTNPACPSATTTSNNMRPNIQMRFYVSALQPPTVTGATTYCSGTTLNLSATTTTTNGVILWAGPNNFSATGPSISIPNVTTTQAGTYTARVTDGTDTSFPKSIVVTVNQTPNAPSFPNVVSNYCEGDLFIPIVANGTGLKWYSVPTGGNATSITPTVNTNIPGTYTWYVSQTVTGCEGPRAPLTITVATPPPPPLVESPVVYCKGDEATPLLAGGQNLKWYKSSTGGLGSTVAPIPQTGAENFSSWYVSQTVNGCEGARARIDVKIVEKPNVLIQSSAEGLCQGEELTLNYYGSGLPIYSYNWGLPKGASLTSGAGMGPITVRFDSAGVQKVTLQVGNEGCYSGIGIKNINVKPLPEGYINAAYNVCQDAVGLVVLDSYSPSIDTFRWDFDGGVMIHEHQDVGPYGIRWSQPGQHIIKLTVKNEECTAILYDTVMVRPLPDASFSGVPSAPVCAGDSLKLTANTIDPASAYQWKPAGFFDNYDQQSSTYARIDFMGPVSLTVTDEFGCVKTDSVMIQTQNCCIVSFPSAFTPNGDGRNDYFHPITTAHLNIKSFKVVNRWGQAVFETAEQSMGWDGTMSGEKLDMGTYFYFISYMCNGIATEQRGEVTLIR